MFPKNIARRQKQVEFIDSRWYTSPNSRTGTQYMCVQKAHMSLKGLDQKPWNKSTFWWSWWKLSWSQWTLAVPSPSTAIICPKPAGSWRSGTGAGDNITADRTILPEVQQPRARAMDGQPGAATEPSVGFRQLVWETLLVKLLYYSSREANHFLSTSKGKAVRKVRIQGERESTDVMLGALCPKPGHFQLHLLLL